VIKPLVIFGNAEIASLAKYYFTVDSDYEVVAFTIDDDYLTESSFLGLPIIPFSLINEKFPSNEFDMHVALSYTRLNRLREEKYNQAKAAGYSLVNYISSKSSTWPDLLVGDNCFILEDQTIQPTVQIGNNVMLWSGNHIGHGTRIGDHTYFASQVVVSGNCKIGKRCFFGVNATLKDFLTVGDDVFVAMDASVTRDLPTDSVVLAAKSRFFESGDPVGEKIKKSYFKL
jgi:sugar O-acyltransferase (sialic acid O-acetyltransferase NeuD family)